MVCRLFVLRGNCHQWWDHGRIKIFYSSTDQLAKWVSSNRLLYTMKNEPNIFIFSTLCIIYLHFGLHSWEKNGNKEFRNSLPSRHLIRNLFYCYRGWRHIGSTEKLTASMEKTKRNEANLFPLNSWINIHEIICMKPISEQLPRCLRIVQRYGLHR